MFKKLFKFNKKKQEENKEVEEIVENLENKEGIDKLEVHNEEVKEEQKEGIENALTEEVQENVLDEVCEAIKEEAERCGMYFVNERWLGGMLTNHQTIQTRIKKLRELEKMEEEGVFNVLPKKEVIKLNAEKEKLEKYKKN